MDAQGAITVSPFRGYPSDYGYDLLLFEGKKRKINTDRLH